jgi:hypothetical protein
MTTRTKAFTFGLPAGLSSRVTLILLAIWSVARAGAAGLMRNTLRGQGEVDLVRYEIRLMSNLQEMKKLLL